MNILYISNDSAFGGAALSLFDILVDMHQKHAVYVVLPKEGEISQALINNGIPYYIVPIEPDFFVSGNLDSASKKAFVAREYKNCKAIIDIINKNKIDIVHTNSSVGNAGLYAAVMTGCPHVWHIREIINEHYNASYFDDEIKRKLFSMSDKVITISQCANERIKTYWGIASSVLYDGIDLTKYPYFDFCSGLRGILIAGLITPDKGQLDVVKAIELVKNRGYDDVILYIVGNAYKRYEWVIKKYVQQHNLEKNVEIHQFVENLSEFREKCLCSVTASRFEALGRVAIETMLSGRIPIGADTGATVELIGSDKTRGLLYKYGNIESLASNIVSLFELDDSSKQKMCIAGYDYAKTRFDIKKHCSDLLTVYKDSIKKYNTKRNEENKKFLFELFADVDANKKESVEIHNCNKKTYSLGTVGLLKKIAFKVPDYLKSEGIRTVAIYGMGICGRNVYDILEQGKIKISFVMDQNADGLNDVCQVLSVDDDSIKVDAIIVSVLQNEQEIINSLKKKRKEKVIGITDIVNIVNKL